MAQFFARMEHLYGHRWTGTYGKATNDTNEPTLSAKQWRGDLSGFAKETIRAAMATCETEFQDWPPTVPQFKALCRASAPAKADPRNAAMLTANAAFQALLTAVKLRTEPINISVHARAGLDAVGGTEAIEQLDSGQRQELGPRFVQAYLASAAAVPERT